MNFQQLMYKILRVPVIYEAHLPSTQEYLQAIRRLDYEDHRLKTLGLEMQLARKKSGL